MLKVERTDLQPLAIGNSDDLQLGDQLIAVGYALDLKGEPSVTAGILSAKNRTITEENGEQLVNLLQTDTAINPGNSGGPLLNSRGEVVGINTAIAGQAQNIGFAIAITPVMDVIGSLQSGTVPDRALMGVTTQPVGDGQGAEIVEIAPGSGAADSDLAVGDVVTAVDGDRDRRARRPRCGHRQAPARRRGHRDRRAQRHDLGHHRHPRQEADLIPRHSETTHPKPPTRNHPPEICLEARYRTRGSLAG